MDTEEKQPQKEPLPGRPFTPGVSGNPGGMVKGTGYKARFRKLVERFSEYKCPDEIMRAIRKTIPDLPVGHFTIEEAEAFVVHMRALKGEAWAFDRLHDKPMQATDITSDGNELRTNIYNVISSDQKTDVKEIHKAADDI